MSVSAAELLAPSGPTAATLSLELPVVELAGADVRRFTNGMLTNNVRDLPVGGVQRTAMVDDRGRVQGLLDLVCLADDRLLAILEGVPAEAFVERYDAYVFAEDVEFAHVTAGHAIRTVQGRGAADALRAAGLPAPEEGRTASHGALLVLPRDRSGLGGFDLVGPADALPDLGLPTLTVEALEVLRVLSGQPRWPVDFGTKQLPHEMRMRDRYLHFEKGCYIGQEAIHRIDVQGQVRRNLMGLRIDGEGLPASGAEVHLDGKVVGRLTSPVLAPGGVVALAVLREAATEPGTEVEVRDAEGARRAVVSDLPFEVGAATSAS